MSVTAAPRSTAVGTLSRVSFSEPFSRVQQMSLRHHGSRADGPTSDAFALSPAVPTRALVQHSFRNKGSITAEHFSDVVVEDVTHEVAEREGWGSDSSVEAHRDAPVLVPTQPNTIADVEVEDVDPVGRRGP